MKAFLIAGEPSGDRLGGALIDGLRQLDPALELQGIGGEAMAAQGLRSLFPMAELSLMGIWEILPKYRALKRRIAETARAVIAAAPDVLVTIDSPDFGLRVARIVRAAAPQVRTVHYVAPSVWAWRAGRAAKMAQVIDHVLAILPFEPPLMRAAGMTCDFVGHPVVAEPVATPDEAAAFRATHGIAAEAPLVLCLPGSRRGEVERLGPRFDEALIRLRDRVPEIRVVLPTVSGVADMLGGMARRWPTAPVIVQDQADKRAAFAAADLALAASGTVSLELAANRVPMVIGYDMAPISRALMGMLLKTDTVTLVNLVSETRAVPEFLGKHCQPGPMASALLRLLDDPDARAEQLAAMDLAMQRLGRGGEPPGLRAARSVMAAVTARR
ncbi:MULTISPECIES: lipid-A-disaccharide synthase [unclassified Paracoccus (in: a-proteobacteria)]|uniref:lipid-A-disaccharide synthase n=1 Tax=unclassified Paracoccus (in: a-proteobacteria) TaxID=2688777 RepID=UPI0016011961|nr:MULTISPECIES: lipid-A-disaccharide synthase [unclassified Paracoccus (in: a-proteobacteria)]MBB1491412.1 lipid-A-disaccharide synthase [Paracoccus sp. MC1854]MBB1499526.1 lipid-A-disaccharide synthase [Paracoccus sp. MC1862]QQO46106.1 lipid-A-disaccharide synthase [Paracoccus sp. MC1862]